MKNTFDKHFKDFYQNIYGSTEEQKKDNVCKFINYIVDNEYIVNEHPKKKNIELIVNKELIKLQSMDKIYKIYVEKLKVVFDKEYDII